MLQHFIIIPFSCPIEYLLKRRGYDPLQPKKLDHRFKIFQIACLPGILNQVSQNFTWILLIDPLLPAKYKDELQKLVSGRQDTHLIPYTKELNIYQLDWLKPLMKQGTEYVTTSILGDDDALFHGFTASIANHFGQLRSSDRLPPVIFSACKNNLFWDFYYSKKATLGYIKPYYSSTRPSAVGFSITCKYPEINLSIFLFSHHNFEYLADNNDEIPEKAGLDFELIKIQRRRIRDAAQSSNLNWDGKLTKANFYYLPDSSYQAIITNHYDNIQLFRLLRNAEKRIPVNREKTFKDFSIDFNLAESYLKKTPAPSKLAFIFFFRIFTLNPERFRNKTRLFKVKQILKDLLELIMGIIKLK